MARISEFMTPNPRTVRPADTLQAAAQAMDDLNVGVLPVSDNGRLVGVLTDRDIVVRSTSAGQDPRSTPVEAVMTTDMHSVLAEASVSDAVRIMEDHQLRRVPVLDPEGKLVGIVSLGDLAAAGTEEAGQALEQVSTPAEPDR